MKRCFSLVYVLCAQQCVSVIVITLANEWKQCTVKCFRCDDATNFPQILSCEWLHRFRFIKRTIVIAIMLSFFLLHRLFAALHHWIWKECVHCAGCWRTRAHGSKIKLSQIEPRDERATWNNFIGMPKIAAMAPDTYSRMADLERGKLVLLFFHFFTFYSQ